MAQAATLAMVDPKVAEFVTGSRRMLIDGAWVEAASGKTFPVYDPATEEVIAQYHLKNSRLKVHALMGCHNEGKWT